MEQTDCISARTPISPRQNVQSPRSASAYALPQRALPHRPTRVEGTRAAVSYSLRPQAAAARRVGKLAPPSRRHERSRGSFR